MANPGVGTKFMSVNLNKSYGQSPHNPHNHPHNPHNHPHNLGAYGSNRARPAGGGGGGMVVLSRPRSSQKVTGPKLSVPPPLNLPSLRKEHQRLDSLGSGGGPAGGGVSGSGSRPNSSGVGWTKPGTVPLQEKDMIDDNHTVDSAGRDLLGVVDGVSRGSSTGAYMPPSARTGALGPSASAPAGAYQQVEKVSVLRGEDFPSLRATLPSTSGQAPKQKEGLYQKQKQEMGEELSNEQRDGSRLSPLVDMRPQLHSSHHGVGNGLSENGSESHSFGGSRISDQARKQEEFFPGPLPLVRLNPRSDWADDERDTGHGLMDRGRDHGSSKSEAYWERDFDMPRISVLPHKPAHNLNNRWGQRDNETGRVSSSEVPRPDPYVRDVRTPSREAREGTSWKASSVHKDGFSAQEVRNDRNGIGARQSSLNRETNKENKYIPSASRDKEDFGRRDVGYGQGGRQPRKNTMDSFNSRGVERNIQDRYGNEQYNRYRDDTFRNSSVSKSSFSSGGKGLPVNDPILNFGREKRPLSKSEKPYREDPFMKDFGAASFDGRDPFSGSLVGVIKRKKDVPKQTDFHDPIRESFEAELERVQKMQEQERQRIIEEQERALELARREEVERARLAREQEERQRRLEEQAREAAWKAEHERLEAMQRAEEHRIAREEEKRRLFMEEERRKQAAKQKLLELEERIAKRQTEAAKGGSNASAVAEEKMSGMVKEKDISAVSDVGDWEDGERMVERITTSAHSDSSSLTRQFDMSSRPQFPRDASSAFMDRGKSVNSWRRDVFENGNSTNFLLPDQENGHQNPKRDAVGGRVFSRKEFYGGSGFVSPRTYYKGGISEPHVEDFTHLKGQKWNISGDEDHYNRNMEIESEFHENLADKFADVGWEQGHRGNPYSPYTERLYQNSEADGLHSFGRSRYSMRQPRVLPPPSVGSMHKNYRDENDRPGPSAFLDSEMQYTHAARSENTMQTGYNSGRPENLEQSEAIDVHRENAGTGEQKQGRNATPGCDSQSSLSVSSPPNSPTHLSHDDLDESGDSPGLSATREGRDVASESEHVALPTKAGEGNMMTTESLVSTGDDEEWTVDNNDQLPEQEEYDEDEDGYQEEDEVHEGDDENIDLTQEFEDMHLEDKGLPHMDNLVLGFNEGVEVGMPNDEFDRSSKNEEYTFAKPQVSVGSLEEHASFDGMCHGGQRLQPVDGSFQVVIDSSPRMTQVTEKAVPEMIIQPNNAPHALGVSELLDHVDIIRSSGLPEVHSVPTPVKMASLASSDQTVTSSEPAVLSQTEVPVKLQFGLFSGPSLVPSPVPAIQIGSIQMPLHLHPQVGPSLSHMHPSRPPLFQFGQLRYTSPISQGILPLTPQSMTFVQPNVPANFSLNQNAGGPLPIQPGQDTPAHNVMENDVLSLTVDIKTGLVTRPLDLSQGNVPKEVNPLQARESTEKIVMVQQGRAEFSNNTKSEPCSMAEEWGQQNSAVKNYRSLSNNREFEGQPQTAVALSQSIWKEKELSGSRAQAPVSSGRGRKYVFTARNSGSRPSFTVPEGSHPDSSGFQRRRRNIQRTEFRVRENADKRQSTGLVSSNHYGVNGKINGRGTGISARSGPRKVAVLNKSPKQIFESEISNAGPISSRETDSGSRADKGTGKELLMKSQNIPFSGEGSLKRNLCSDEDADTPLQSGIVRVFEQPGIEAPSDEDDFIEVRSKRQMLNDRREQREKEIKAKSRGSKTPQKPRSSQRTSGSTSSNKVSPSSSREAASIIQPDFVPTDGRGLANIEVSAGFSTTIVSQPLAPIGTPAVKTETQADLRSHTIKSHQASSLPTVSGGGKSLGSGLIYENKNKVLDSVQTSLGSWGNSRANQQVMTLTQTQLDEAMKPAQFDTPASVGDHTGSVTEPSIPSSSILSKDKSYSSATSPINSLLAGEKIQFGAVTSPTILPPSSCVISHGIGPPSPCRSDIQISHNLPGSDSDCSLFFKKDKHPNESRVHLEDCEAEAEAAASAVAVAAISSDEIVGNGRDSHSVSVSDTKSFGVDIDGITAGVDGDQQSATHSRAEESLSVALPADLSVENPPISLWPPLPSPQNSSSQMLSHFPRGPPSHFPFYEMNPLLGGPIFAFGPHDESASTQSQQKSNASGSGPLGTWQQCHSGVDSFYGPPAGFTGPFISPHGGIPGVQGPPHMVVYNHFAPVGQFGQVGLSFMGATYIPSGKQPDWKHNPTSSAMGVGEGDMNNLNMVSAQHNPANIPAPIQHLAPGSPLMASPLAMFDVSPFQSSPDISVQAHWSHVPAALQSVPMSLPLQQPAEGALPSPFSRGLPVDQSLNANRFSESRTSTPSDSGRNFPVASDSTVTQLPDELGLVEPSSSTGAVATHSANVKSSSVRTIAGSGKADVLNGSGSNSNSQNATSAFKAQSSHQKNVSTQQYNHPSGHNYQRGGISQKRNLGGEWSHRRMGFQGRDQPLGAERNFPSSKMKQIYVAKQTSTGGSTVS